MCAQCLTIPQEEKHISRPLSTLSPIGACPILSRIPLPTPLRVSIPPSQGLLISPPQGLLSYLPSPIHPSSFFPRPGNPLSLGPVPPGMPLTFALPIHRPIIDPPTVLHKDPQLGVTLWEDTTLSAGLGQGPYDTLTPIARSALERRTWTKGIWTSVWS